MAQILSADVFVQAQFSTDNRTKAMRRIGRAVRPVLEVLESRQMLSALPAVLIQAENFDQGGEGVAYHDTTTANLGGAYRTSEGVDVEATSDAGGGYDIGSMATGEWMQYTINVASAGTYRLDFRLYSSSTNGSFHANIDGVNRTGAMAMPNSPGWQTLSSPTFTLTAGQHTIRFAVDSTGTSASLGWLNWLQLTNVAPTAASGLTATAASSSAIALNWTDNATDETAYTVERKTGSSGTYAVIATLAANSKTYSDSGLAASTQYYYRVQAANGPSTSAYSAEVSATTLAATGTAPAAPSSLTATASSASTIALTWKDNATDETGFTLQRKTGSGGTYATIATLAANATSYNDSGLAASTQYYYRVCAVKGTLSSSYSSQVSATTLAATVVTPTWTNTAFTAQTGQFTADFDATPQTANMDMVMGLSNGSTTAFTGLATIVRFNTTGTIDVRNGANYGADATVSYTPGTKYHIKLSVNVATHTYDVYVTVGAVTTKIATGYAFRTEQAGVTQLSSLTTYNTSGSAVIAGLAVAAASTPTVPTAPSGLTATASSSSAIALSWADNATNESGYRVDRSTDGTTFTQIASLGAGVSNYTDSSLSASTKYYYRVCACSSVGDSAYTSVASATTQSATVTSPVLVSPPQAAVDAAIAMPLIRFTRSVTNGAFTNDAWDGGASITLAEAAYAGNTSADARLLQQMRYSMTGGNEIVANGGFASQCELWVTSMFAIAKNTPRIWSQLTAAEQAKVDLIMEASLISSAFVTSDTNPNVVSGGTQYGLDGDTNLNRDWNPNYRQGMLGGVLNGVAYFGATKAQSILSTYNHATFVSQLQAAGLTNLYTTFNWKVANPSSAAPSASTIQSTVQGYKYHGMAATNVVGIYADVMRFTYSMNVNAGLNGGTGLNGAGMLVSGASTLPNQGALGMILEFDTTDGGGSRSSAGYSYDDYRAAMCNTLSLISAGMWDISSTTMKDIGTRVNIGNTDLAYKIQKGYIGYSKGTSEGVFDITQTQWGFSYNLPMWDSVLKQFVNGTQTVTVPAAPTSLAAAATSSSAISLSWTDNATNETGYRVERSTDGTNFTQIATPGTGATSYTDSSLSSSTKYYYQVCAYNSAGDSADSNMANATTQTAVTVPAAPTGLAATATSTSAVSLNWTDNATNESGYYVERKTGSAGTYAVIATLAAGSKSYSDSGLTASTQYYYRVRAYNSAGTSAYTAEASATTQAAVTAPAAPSGLSASATSSSAVTLSWVDNATNETAYSVERKTGSAGTYAVIATLAANSTGYSDSGLAASTQYYYRVRASNSAGSSAYSAEMSATTQAASSSSSVVLTPGSGFTGATATPARMGTSSQFGYNDKVIAHWDTVPFQTTSGQLNVGIVAFHNSGIDRVDFSVNGGAWTSVKTMTLNPTTGVVEYWCTLDASKFSADGKVEIRAIAYPKVGIPRVFQGTTNADNGEQSLFLNVNARGTLASNAVYVSASGSDSNAGTQASPFKTIGKAASALGAAGDGGTIYLMAGDYTNGAGTSTATTSSRWLTITTAPGVAKSAVRIVGSSGNGLGTKLVHFQNLTFAPADGTAQYILANTVADASVWVDNCNLIGPGRTVDSSWGAGDFSGVYVTDTTISACRDGIAGDLVRNVTISGIGSDAFSGAHMVINSSVSGTDGSGTTFHADVFQLYGGGVTLENYILYGVTARVGTDDGGQGIFVGRESPTTDIAIVNCDISNQTSPNSAVAFSFESPTANLYIKGSTFDGNAFWRDDFTFVATDVVVESSTFTWGLHSDQNPEPGVTIR